MSYQQINDTWIYQEDKGFGDRLFGLFFFLVGLLFFGLSLAGVLHNEGEPQTVGERIGACAFSFIFILAGFLDVNGLRESHH